MSDNLYCDQTTPWQGVYFFYQYCFIGKMIHHICVIPILLCCTMLPHISPWTQSWIQAFIVAYEKLTFKLVKQNCCFRNQHWDAVKSCQASSEKRLHQIDQSECNIFCQNISNSNLNWYTDEPFCDWYIYKPVNMPHKWIGSTPK